MKLHNEREKQRRATAKKEKEQREKEQQKEKSPIKKPSQIETKLEVTEAFEIPC